MLGLGLGLRVGLEIGVRVRVGLRVRARASRVLKNALIFALFGYKMCRNAL